jgi:DNA-binding NarL/FixJ family response regulator
MRHPTIILADDHAVVREGLVKILQPSFEVLAAVEDGRQLLDAARSLNPDAIVLDLSMPALNGVEAIRQLRRERVRSRVVVLTMHSDVAYATEAFEAGASGYVLKHSAAAELVKGIHEVLDGRVFISPEIEQEVLPFILKGAHQSRKSVMSLTPRQREVLQLVAEGHTMKEVARLLNVSPRTVEFHKYKMMQELGLHSTAELTQYALKHRIVST